LAPLIPARPQSQGHACREHSRIDGGGYRREHLRALAQRVEIADKAVRIIGSKGDLLGPLPPLRGLNPLRPAFAVLF
jgi:site-specific DNA recombinase